MATKTPPGFNFFEYFEKPELLPLTYTYGGVKHKGLPADAMRDEKTTDAVTKITYTARLQDNVELKAECTTYVNYPVIEWVCYFKNNGNSNTAMFSEIKPLETLIAGKNPIVKTNTGDFHSIDGFIDTIHDLTDGVTVRSVPSGGRSSDGAWPYQKLMFSDFGLNIAIGWSGTWFSEYTGIANGVAASIGQARCNTYLKPGETYRTPTVTLMIYTGDEDCGVNLWRKWFYDHILIKENGEPLKGKTVSFESGGGLEFIKATEANQLESLDLIDKEKFDINVWWIDAGWYKMKVDPKHRRDNDPLDDEHWWIAGTWQHDEKRFPAGLRPVGEKCAELGIDFLMWFEPLRVFRGSELHIKHPDWMLHNPGGYETNDNGLLDITNPDCFDWLCKHVSGLIKEYKIKWYREDFNFPPSYRWENNETDDRIGMVENLHVQAFYKYWDYLKQDNPDLLIDSCASGGRRNDLETMRRGVPLHHTDFGYGYKPVCQAFAYHMSRWLPYYKSFLQVWDDGDQSYPANPPEDAIVHEVDSYALLNNIGPMMALMFPKQYCENKTVAKFIDEIIMPAWRKASPMMLTGDFYSLTEPHRDSTKWTVFQFHMPDANEGMFKVMRNQQCDIPSVIVWPKAFDPAENYTFTNAETAETYTKTGKEVLENGVTFAQEKRSAGVWFYGRSQ